MEYHDFYHSANEHRSGRHTGQAGSVFDKKWSFSKREYIIHAVAQGWPYGTLFLKIKSEGQTAFRRLIKTN
jgi:hypothetical protein